MYAILLTLAVAAQPNVWAAAPSNVWASTACGQGVCICPGGTCACGIGADCPTACPIGAHEWRTTADGTQAGLYVDGVQIGAYRFSDEAYRPLHGDTWGGYCKPPVAVPPVLLSHWEETCHRRGSRQQSTSQLSAAAPAVDGSYFAPQFAGPSGCSGGQCGGGGRGLFRRR